MSSPIGSTSGISIEGIQQRIAPSLQGAEKNMKTALTNIGPDATTQDLLAAQIAAQQWTMQAQLQSALVKECGDALKGIIQKSG